MAEAKPAFAPLPIRAIRDARLSGLHLRVLAVVAYHDRLSKNRKTRDGAGCYASNATLADAVGCNYTNLSTAITDLGRCGYLTRETHPMNRRLRVLRVRYETAEGLPIGKESDPDALPNGKDEGLPNGKGIAPILCPANEQASDNVDVSSLNIFRKTGNRFRGNEERNSSEEASPSRRVVDDPNVGATLAALERRLKGKRVNEHELPTVRTYLLEVQEAHDEHTPTWHQAERLLNLVIDEAFG